AGDVAGDGKADFVDFIDGSNSVQVWLSRGDGTFLVTPFSPSSTYGVSSARMHQGDINGDGKTDFIDFVDGTNYANVWLSRGDGTFDVRLFSPWPSYGISSARIREADVNGDGRTDFIDVVDGTTNANVWISQ